MKHLSDVGDGFIRVHLGIVNKEGNINYIILIHFYYVDPSKFHLSSF